MSCLRIAGALLLLCMGAAGVEAQTVASSFDELGVFVKPGDKIMQTKNDYELGVFNGDLGRVVTIDLEEKKLVARFDDRMVTYGPSEMEALTLAYACSIHKSQGSEYPAVVVPVSTQERAAPRRRTRSSATRPHSPVS